MRVRWMDPRSENRYGDQKHYDPSLPVFADWLPHVSSILGALTPGSPQRCTKLELQRGAAAIEIDLALGDVPCSVQLVRNGDQRKRLMEVATAKGVLQLDFSREPGTIIVDSARTNGDPDWETAGRPAACMLAAFLQWAAGGEFDSRLDTTIGLRAASVIDQSWSLYRPAQAAWLNAKLGSGEPLDEDLRYALSEMLQPNASFPASEIDRQIERVLQRFSGKDCAVWLGELGRAQDLPEFFRTIAV